MTEQESENSVPKASRVTAGAIALLAAAILYVATLFALERQDFLLPPLLVFFTLEHPILPAVLALLVCLIDVVVRHTVTRLLFTGIAVLLLLLAFASADRYQTFDASPPNRTHHE